MKIKLLAIGKTDDSALISLISRYQDRLQHYVSFDLDILPDLKQVKNMSESEQKIKEGSLIQKQLKPGDFVCLLDERGREFNSVDFSKYLQKRMNSGLKRLVFVIGGPYGFSEEIYKIAQG